MELLEANKERVIYEIRQQILEKDIKNLADRVNFVMKRSHGEHMPEIIFKIFSFLMNFFLRSFKTLQIIYVRNSSQNNNLCLQQLYLKFAFYP